MNYRDYTKMDMEEQRRLLTKYKKELKGMPQGYLAANNKGKYMEYYQIIGNKRIYIKKNDTLLINTLKRKKFLEKSIKRIEKNLIGQEKILSHYMPYDFSAVQEAIPEVYRFNTSIKKYKETIPYGNQVLHQTSCGLKVRSKSEMMIVELLISHGIEFEYEKPLEIYNEGGQKITIHPDFTFRTRSGKWIYWEHLGRLDLEEYRQDTIWKLQRYFENGILPSINLLLTVDDLDGSLDMSTIIGTIEYLKKLI